MFRRTVKVVAAKSAVSVNFQGGESRKLDQVEALLCRTPPVLRTSTEVWGFMDLK
jgi:hypothetical protein